MLTIPMGHTLAALRDVLGEVAEVSAVLTTQRTTAVAADTGERLPVSAPDQVLVSGILASGAPLSIHYRGGTPRDGDGLLWEINGTEGDIRVSGPSGHTQMVQLFLKGAQDAEPGNVARLYARMARDLREGTRSAPSFQDAVAVHRVIAAIERAAESGSRIMLAGFGQA
jgi:predicted dehydrogenase